MTSPIRRTNAVWEGPAQDPANDNQFARRGYVDPIALPTDGNTDYVLCKNAAGGARGKFMPPHVAAAALVSNVNNAVGGGSALDFVANGASGLFNIIMTTTGGITINVPSGGFDNLPVHFTIWNNVGTTQTVTFASGYNRLTGLTLANPIPTGKILRAAVRRTDITGAPQWIIESIGITP